MIIGITHFGDPAFLPLLNAWIEQYKKSGCKYRVVIICDLDVPVPPDAVPYEKDGTAPLSYLRFYTNAIPSIVRKGKNFDIKGTLLCQSIQVLGRCIILDADAFFVKDPTRIIEGLPKVAFGIGDDPNVRQISGLNEYVRECNAGVLYFGTDNSQDRKDIASLYEIQYGFCKERNNNTMLEQIAWTMVGHILMKQNRAIQLPRQLNWSYIWGRNTNETYILHEHGPQKWNRVKDAHREPSGEISHKYKAYYYA